MAETAVAPVASNTRNGRGVSWRYQETLDLLEIWGESKIQEQLRSSHRNIYFFQYIAGEMAARGHERTALECRNKTKVMRLEYKRVVDHNSRSGNTRATCPFFSELHRILRGDASVTPKRVGRRHLSAAQLLLPSPEDLGAGLSAVNAEDHVDERAGFSEEILPAEDPAGEQLPPGGTPSPLPNAEHNSADGGGASGGQTDDDRPGPSDPCAKVGPAIANPMATLSPSARLGWHKGRRQRGERTETLLLQLVEQNRREQEQMTEERAVARSLLAALDKEREQERQERERDRQERERDRQERHQERAEERARAQESNRLFRESMLANTELLRALVARIGPLSETLVSSQGASYGSPQPQRERRSRRKKVKPSSADCYGGEDGDVGRDSQLQLSRPPEGGVVPVPSSAYAEPLDGTQAGPALRADESCSSPVIPQLLHPPLEPSLEPPISSSDSLQGDSSDAETFTDCPEEGPAASRPPASAPVSPLLATPEMLLYSKEEHFLETEGTRRHLPREEGV
ncbi:uncharacterized protein LOC134395582 [Elgaria multicarinata webbii]|uniref:uncharacterized protein LOC134395582 n=1 Tax=Elgaria multicarinata webbii TaxID=159646 RepID=UPI002FCD2228